MAVPLAATLQPIEQPLPLQVGAEAAIVYDTGGDPNPLDDITIDFYTSGGLDAAIVGSIIDAGYYLPQHPEATTDKADDFFQGAPAQVTRDFFYGEAATPVVEVIFFWEDVASFFWWQSPFDETEGFVTPSIAFNDFFVAAGPPDGNDFFTAIASSVGGTLWDGGDTLWDEGDTVWA